MALFGNRHYEEDFDISTKYKEDLFSCSECGIEFGLESEKIKNKNVSCPICKKKLEAWRKGVG